MKTMTGIGPQHEMAKGLVRVPTVVSREMKFGESTLKSVFIQWYGQADGPNMPEDAQFFFDTMRKPDNPVWLDRPETFRVVFIGQIRHWPNPQAIRQMVETFGVTPETFIAWLMSPLGPRHLEPSSPMMQITVLGDPNYGVIKPRLYSDLSVRDAILKEIEDGMSWGDKLAKNYRQELPPEEIPWAENPGTCSACDHFEHSRSDKPAIPPKGLGDGQSLSFICPSCRRRWWQYNNYYHLWKHVNDQGEWDGIRRQQLLKDAGYEFPEQ